MTLADLATFVCTKVGKTDSDSIAACKTYLKQRHEMIVDAYPWKDALGVFDVAVASGAQYAILPAEAARPWAVWDKSKGYDIHVGNLAKTIATKPTDLETLGDLWTFVEMDAVGWPYVLPTNGAQLAFINTGTTAISISISGQRNLGFTSPTTPDVTYTETISLGASGGTNTSSMWKVIHRMQKPAGGGVIVSQTGVVPDQAWVWPADSTEASFARIRLINPPTDATTLQVLCKRKIRQMNLDTDGPMIRNIENALLAFAQGDMLERSRQYSKAAAKVQEAVALLEGAKDIERNQSAKDSVITPDVALEGGESWTRW